MVVERGKLVEKSAGGRQLPFDNCPSPGTKAPRDKQRKQNRKERGEAVSFLPDVIYLFIYFSLASQSSVIPSSFLSHTVDYGRMNTQQGPQARVPLNAIVVG